MDSSRYCYKSKGKTLCLIRSKNIKFKVPKLVLFIAKDLDGSLDKVFNKVSDTFKSKKIVVRSSASDEDGRENSSAGEYESVLNIPSNNSKIIAAAIKMVIASYKKKRPLLLEDEVIIQEMVQNTIMSGVIFTHDLNTGAPI